MRPDTEALFAYLLDRRLRRHNERLWGHLVAWSEVLGALGWCVAIKAADGCPLLNQCARNQQKSDAPNAGSWSDIESALATDADLVRAIQTPEVQVWAHPGAAAPVPLVGAASLTRREAEVLGWLRTGKSGPEIAIILGCAVRTIETHVANLYRKLGIRTRTALLVRPFLIGGKIPLDP